MNRKRKKQMITTMAVLLFFLIGGIWYAVYRNTASEPAERETNITGVLENIPWEEEPSEQESKEPEEVLVYVCGAVNQPGVYTLGKNSRLYEAVALAGGFSEVADCSYHNLARTLTDGERVYILSTEETSRLTTEQQVDGETEAAKSYIQEEGLININLADKKQLMELPGIGEAKAESIIEYRTRIGQFTNIEEIKNVSGIGDAMFEKIKDRIMVQLN